MEEKTIPIIAIDGTVASGKGTIASLLAQKLGFNYLNSGALYRLSAHLAIINNIDINDKTEENLNKVVSLLLAEKQHVSFSGKRIIYRDQDIWPMLSSQEMGNAAAVISPYPPLRHAIYAFERSKAELPGLVAEGRAMTTETFVDAQVKIYLDASVESRAQRRLIDEEKRSSGKTYEMLCDELRKRDDADKNRPMGALRLAPDAFYIDTSDMNVEEVLEECLAWCKEKGVTI